eukprot:ANDGO_04912.mRNA.1 hypothetical protein
MAVGFEVYSEAVKRRYRARFFSRACFLNMGLWVTFIIVPFVVAYATPGFWVKEVIVREQPKVTYLHEAVLTTFPSGGWTSSSDLNYLVSSYNNLLDVDFSVTRVDLNGNGRPDWFDVKAVIPLYSAAATSGTLSTIRGLQCALSFQVEFSSTVSTTLTALAYISVENPADGSAVYVDGRLAFVQSQPILQTRTRAVYTASPFIFSPNTQGLEGVALPDVVRAYMNRNETMQFTTDATVWSAGAAPFFTLQARIRVPGMQIAYRPGLWELLKYGWIQYIAVWVIIYFPVSAIRNWIMRNQLLPTRVFFDQVPRLHKD